MNNQANSTDATQSTDAPPSTMPETIEVNGVTYRREADWVDKAVSEIKCYQEIAKRTGLTLRQAYWLSGPGTVLPD